MNLCDEKTIRELLGRHGFHFSKSMGQNFLIDPQIPAYIAAASGADETCGVLEIGPGIGPLTAELAQRAGCDSFTRCGILCIICRQMWINI